MEKIQIKVLKDDNLDRLDAFLSTKCELSRSQIQKLIKENQERNAEIKNNALEEINNAVITEDTKEAMPEVKENVEEISKENKFFVEEYKNCIVLGSLAIVAIVCILLIIVFSIKNKRKK